MLIGIKYCGGCQSRYDRAAVVKQITEAHPQHKFAYVNENIQYDAILVICGCHVKCVTVSQYKTKQFIWIDSTNLEKTETVFNQTTKII